MICCQPSEQKILGMTKVPTDEVIRACKRTLESIYRSRSEIRHNYVRQWLVTATGRWRFFWRWLGFKQPTRRDALFDYFHGGRFPPHLSEIMSYGNQEDKCKKLLRSAQASVGNSMWISPEGANFCRL